MTMKLYAVPAFKPVMVAQPSAETGIMLARLRSVTPLRIQATK